MDASPLPGYITRKEAALRCQRAERTLQRYWSRAIELEDRSVLSHLELRTEDGRIIEGPSVTKQQIEDLKSAGQNPTWFAEEQWVMDMYGPRSHAPRSDGQREGEVEQAEIEEGSAELADAALVAALQSENAELRRDKERLYAELNIKNEQIKEANARTRESNTLMQELHVMFGNWPGQALNQLPSRTHTRFSGATENTSTEEEGGPPAHVARSRRSAQQAGGKKRPGSPTARKPKWYEMPTLKRYLSRS